MSISMFPMYRSQVSPVRLWLFRVHFWELLCLWLRILILLEPTE